MLFGYLKSRKRSLSLVCWRPGSLFLVFATFWAKNRRPSFSENILMFPRAGAPLAIGFLWQWIWAGASQLSLRFVPTSPSVVSCVIVPFLRFELVSVVSRVRRFRFSFFFFTFVVGFCCGGFAFGVGYSCVRRFRACV